MVEFLKKLIFYGCFSAVGVFWAEVLSSNIPYALASPAAYLIYGLLYVFFIDAMLRYGVSSLKTAYVYGFLVGFITETYVAKVVFYGLEPDAHRMFGFAAGTILFVVAFFHAFFSFMIPVYLAKRLLGVPFNMETKKTYDLVALLAPLLLLPMVAKKMLSFGPAEYALSYLLSAVILLGWVLLLRISGDVKNVLFTWREREGLLAATVLIYAFFTHTLGNSANGRAPGEYPLPQMIAATAFIMLLLKLVHGKIAQSGAARTEIPYQKNRIRLSLFVGWLLLQSAASLVLALALAGMQEALPALLGAMILAGIIAGPVSFVLSVKYLLSKH